MLSFAQADNFLVQIIKFENWKQVLECDTLEFLQLLVPHYAHHCYFQNVSMSAVPPKQRRVADEHDIINAGLSGLGGNCLTQNGFLDMLLKTIGLKSYLISGYLHGPRNLPDNHVMCVVEITEEEKYLFDLGVGLPFVEPVPLHKLPYTQIAGGYRYRYVKGSADNDKVLYYRMQLDGALFGGEFDDLSTEYVRYEFTLEPRPLRFFQCIFSLIYNNVERSTFLQCPFLFRYFEEDETGKLTDEPNTGKDRKWILVRGVSVLVGTNIVRDIKHYSSYDEVKLIIFKYFPKLSYEEVERAIQNYTYGCDTNSS